MRRNKVLALCLSSAVMLLAFGGFLLKGEFERMDREMADLDSKIGKTVVVAGVAKATVVTLDGNDVYVLGRFEGGVPSIRKVERDRVVFE